MKKKIIGIAGTHAFGMKERFKDYSQTYVNQDFVTAVIKAGGIPIILPINEDKILAKEYIAMIDGLMLTGGKDLDPKLYGEKPTAKLGETCPSRDISDILYLKEANDVKKPILGICRGMQVINSVFGGTLYQDISFFKAEGEIKHDQKLNPGKKTHQVKLNEGTLLKAILQKDKIEVNSFHHQIIKDVAPDFKVEAISPDGVVEGINYTKNNQFIFGVQWHPEMLNAKNDLDSLKIFKAFIERT